MKGIRLGELITINRPIAEREEGGERGVHDVGRKKVEHQSPLVPPPLGWPRLNDAPLKCERASEKTDVLEIVPIFVCECKIVGRGHMPAEEG